MDRRRGKHRSRQDRQGLLNRGSEGLWKELDSHRKAAAGSSERELRELANRRDKIAHTGDRTPTGRSALSLTQVEAFYDNAKSIVEAMEAIL
jgi:hypothetical protein